MGNNFLDLKGTTSSSFKIGTKGVTLISKIGSYENSTRRYLVTSEVDADGNNLALLYVDEAEARFKNIEEGSVITGVSERLGTQLQVSTDSENGVGWYKIVSIPVSDLLSQYEDLQTGVYSLLLEVNGVDGPDNTAAYVYSGLIEVDFQVTNGVIDISNKAYYTPKILSGTLSKSFVATLPNETSNALEVYFNLSNIGATYSVTILAENYGASFVDVFRKSENFNVEFYKTDADLTENELTLASVDASVDSTKVYFTEDLVITKDLGNYTVGDTGNLTIPTLSDSMSLQDLLKNAFQKEENPVVVTPSCEIKLNTVPESSYYEIGTSYTPNYTCTFDKGSYSWNDTDVSITSFEIKDSRSNVIISGDAIAFSEINENVKSIVLGESGENEEYNLTLSLVYSDGAIPLTNLGNEYTEGQITTATISSTSESVSTARFMFFGAVTEKQEISTLTSDIIRSLDGKQKAEVINNLSLPIPSGAQRVIIAVPSSLKVSNVKNGSSLSIIDSFESATLDVEGANNFTAISYTIYYLDYASGLSKNTEYSITIENA